MAKSLFIARQSAHPTGLFGRFVAHVMARETAPVNDWVLAQLEPKPGDSILEVGCGHGRSLARIATDLPPAGRVVGIDPSTVMRQEAERRNHRAIEAGTVSVEKGDAEHVPYEADCFDKWLSVHTVYFWPDLARGLREAARVLRPGGQFFLGFHLGDNEQIASKLPTSVYTLYRREDVEATLADVGFEQIVTRTEPKTGIALACARARG